MNQIKLGRPLFGSDPREPLVSVMIKITPDQRKWIEDEAWATRRSMAQVIRDLIQEAKVNP